MIHCSDGWDRTSQISSLSQLLLDPYYRTFEGFVVLIEKEWLSFGHQFGNRNGLYLTKEMNEDQRSPIFLQWLDCIHQVINQYPQAFEFNLDFLDFIAYHLNSCLYGTFLFNCEKDRYINKAKTSTISIWTDALNNKNKENFTNPFYSQNIKKELIPNSSIYKLRLWDEYFLKYKPNENNMKFYEIIKKKDNITIKNQNNLSLNLNNIIKDLAFVTYKNKINDQLSENTKLYLDKLNKLQNDEKKEPICVNKNYVQILDNYINK